MFGHRDEYNAFDGYGQFDDSHLKDEYNIYVACAEALGWPVKTFEEWLESWQHLRSKYTES